MREAMSIGCAVIGGDTEPVQEFITHGENGLLTPTQKIRRPLVLRDHAGTLAQLHGEVRAG